jgi:hypothetical protein
MWLSPGVALYDRLNTRAFTLLVLADVETKPLEQAFAAFGAPLDILRIEDAQIRRVYERDLLLIRPDLHVVWRGDALPEEARRLAAIATGNGENN